MIDLQLINIVLQLDGHGVDILAQGLQFVAGRDLALLAEIHLADAFSGLVNLLDGVSDAARHKITHHCGQQKGKQEYYRGIEVEATLLPKIQVDIVVSKVPVRTVIETAKKVLYTGHIGDGKIFVYDVENVVKVRTGEEGYDALQDVE